MEVSKFGGRSAATIHYLSEDCTAKNTTKMGNTEGKVKQDPPGNAEILPKPTNNKATTFSEDETQCNLCLCSVKSRTVEKKQYTEY